MFDYPKRVDAHIRDELFRITAGYQNVPASLVVEDSRSAVVIDSSEVLQ